MLLFELKHEKSLDVKGPADSSEDIRADSFLFPGDYELMKTKW